MKFEKLIVVKDIGLVDVDDNVRVKDESAQEDHIPISNLLKDKGLIFIVPSTMYKVHSNSIEINEVAYQMFRDCIDDVTSLYTDEEIASLPQTNQNRLLNKDQTESTFDLNPAISDGSDDSSDDSVCVNDLSKSRSPSPSSRSSTPSSSQSGPPSPLLEKRLSRESAKRKSVSHSEDPGTSLMAGKCRLRGRTTVRIRKEDDNDVVAKEDEEVESGDPSLRSRKRKRTTRKMMISDHSEDDEINYDHVDGKESAPLNQDDTLIHFKID